MSGSSEPVCPICQRAPTQAFRPFCSKRCADVDLGRWLTNSYAIPVTDDEDADDGDARERRPLDEG
jgi:endogenous inhibitor of DNA gyrase (YacG/DUF329 family)